MRLRVGCEFVHDMQAPAHAVFQVEPRLDGDFAIVEDRWTMEPAVASTRFVDSFGNLCRRLTLPLGPSTVRYDATIEMEGRPDEWQTDAPEVAPERLPSDTLVFTLPSRFCPSDQLGDTAWELFGSVEPGWPRVQAICDWVNRELTFGYGSSTAVTTALDVFESRKGVCRDFAQLAVTFCRSFNIPTRYAFGYLPDIGVPSTGATMDFCAWMEVYLGDRWYTFDPRNNGQRRVGRVLIGRGRDALDVAMVTSFGWAQLQSMIVWADQVPE